MRVCAGFPVWGDAIAEHGLDSMVGLARDAGADGLWVGDHVALSRSDMSAYPGKRSGRFFLKPTSPWYEAMTTLGFIAAHAGSMDLGLSVALPVLRPPVLFAKQVATLSQLSAGKVSLGVGTGWQRAEYDAVGVPWTERGARLDRCIDVIRECWTGEPSPGSYGSYEIPPGLTSYPTPRREVPILVGGSSSAAMRRASRLGDGWIGALQDWDGGLEAAADLLGRFREVWKTDQARRAEDPGIAVVAPVPGHVMRRAGFTRELSERLSALAGLGFDTVVLGFSWRRLSDARAMLDRMREVSAILRPGEAAGASKETSHA